LLKTKKTKKPAQRRKKKLHIVKERKKKNLAESDKGPWFGQTPSTIFGVC